jgi:hypothetical protein
MPHAMQRKMQLEGELRAAHEHLFELAMRGKPGSQQAPVSAEELAGAVAEFGRVLLVYLEVNN